MAALLVYIILIWTVLYLRDEGKKIISFPLLDIPYAQEPYKITENAT